MPSDLEILLDQSIENSGEIHEKVISDCSFCDYEMLVKAEEKREKDIYLPNRRLESSKNDKTEKGKYKQEAFTKDAEGDYVCPHGLKMELKSTVKHDDGHNVFIYHGTGCVECPLKSKCCTGKVRTINLDSRLPYRDLMRNKLATTAGREIYSKRQGLIESLHGDDQKNKMWIQHHLRRLKKEALEFLLIRIEVDPRPTIRLSNNHNTSNRVAKKIYFSKNYAIFFAKLLQSRLLDSLNCGESGIDYYIRKAAHCLSISNFMIGAYSY